MPDRPLFSVIMPVYNRSGLIAESIQSILNQSFSSFETIVVDDGSTDDTAAVVKSFPSVTLLVQKNSGPGAARNLASQSANGRYLAFLDSDDLWFPWSLETYARVISEQNSPAFIAGKPFPFRNTDDLQNVERTDVTLNTFNDYLESGDQWRWFGVSSFVIRRDAFLEAGGFMDGRVNCEDADLALRLGTARGFVQMRSPCTFSYRNHDSNVTFDLSKTYRGVLSILSRESNSEFPGGNDRAAERWRIISRHIRPHSIELAKRGDHRAMSLFTKTFNWHLKTRRIKYLASLPFLYLGGLLRKPFTGQG